MKQCDICLKETDNLVDLLDCYKTSQIKQLCTDCEKVVNKHKSELQTVTSRMLTDWLKRFMTNKREQS